MSVTQISTAMITDATILNADIGAAAATFDVAHSGLATPSTAIGFNTNGGRHAERVTCTTASVMAAGESTQLIRDSTDTSWLQFDCRL